jgi:hypothetical protein
VVLGHYFEFFASLPALEDGILRSGVSTIVDSLWLIPLHELLGAPSLQSVTFGLEFVFTRLFHICYWP